MIKANISPEESILQNLETWCYEVGSDFEEMGKQAAIDFSKYIKKDPYILELGCGDGASTNKFTELGFHILAIDINPEKLKKIKKYTVWQADMLEALKSLKNNSVSNIFAHHSLEHVVNVDEVLIEISRVLKSGGYFYAIVPAKDYLHSVHHVVFESAEELLPPGLIAIKAEYQERNEPEYICIAQKGI